ncbi:MAG: cell division protein ZipA C-terminal FtsZ-binding domain-containing protein [Candidatus Competibacteraceae bacterium]
MPSRAGCGGKPVFSIAHLREPGVFRSENHRNVANSRVASIHALAGTFGAIPEAFTFMLSHSRELAEALGGEVSVTNTTIANQSTHGSFAEQNQRVRASTVASSSLLMSTPDFVTRIAELRNSSSIATIIVITCWMIRSLPDAEYDRLLRELQNLPEQVS